MDIVQFSITCLCKSGFQNLYEDKIEYCTQISIFITRDNLSLYIYSEKLLILPKLILYFCYYTNYILCVKYLNALVILTIDFRFC